MCPQIAYFICATKMEGYVELLKRADFVQINRAEMGNDTINLSDIAERELLLLSRGDLTKEIVAFDETALINVLTRSMSAGVEGGSPEPEPETKNVKNTEN